MPPLALEFVQSAKKTSTLPATDAEVAFVGRSNVGKSSLINALANRRQLARVSNTPGRTQLLNLFTLRTGGTVMDLPGYGYAAVNANTRSTWGPMIENYLLEREGLVMVFVLVDGLVGPTKLDVQMLEWLRFHEVDHTVIATKLDKVKPSRIGDRRRDLAVGCSLHTNDVLWVSASKGTGIDALRTRVIDLLRPPAERTPSPRPAPNPQTSRDPSTPGKNPAPVPLSEREPTRDTPGTRDIPGRTAESRDSAKLPIDTQAATPRTGNDGGMRIEVDLLKCESNGLCVGVAPDVFQINDDDVLELLQQNPSDERRVAVTQAARLCPKQAITVHD